MEENILKIKCNLSVANNILVYLIKKNFITGVYYKVIRGEMSNCPERAGQK
jgi:ribosomal protein S12